jgi:hypothetical protein
MGLWSLREKRNEDGELGDPSEIVQAIPVQRQLISGLAKIMPKWPPHHENMEIFLGDKRLV